MGSLSLVRAKTAQVLAMLALGLLSVGAHATAPTVDITAATDGISAAQTAVLGVIAAMIVMAVAVWAVKRVLKFFGR